MSIPANLSIVFLLFAFVPGWLYLRLMERIRAPRSESPISELFQMFAVGVTTTGSAIVVFVLLPTQIPPFIVNRDDLVSYGGSYVRDNVRPVVLTVACILGLASALAYCFYRVQRAFTPAEFRPQGNVWVHSMGDYSKGTRPWVGVEMQDGRLIEGFLHSYTLEHDANEDRDIALASPRITPKDSQVPYLPPVDRVIIPAGQIVSITIVEVPLDKLGGTAPT